MNAFMRALLVFPAVLCNVAGSDPGPWKVVTFPVEAGLVSSVSIDRGRVAVGLTAGAVRIVDTGVSEPASVSDPVFGPKGRILSLSWFDGDLWIAAQKGLFRYVPAVAGLERGQERIPAGIRTGVKVVKTQGGALWLASSRRLAKLEAGAKGAYKEWLFPTEIEPTCILRVAGRVLVGTGSKGLLVLDTLTERWVRFGISDGLSSDQVSAVEWMGDQLLVGTSEGIDALDLSSLISRRIAQGFPVSWMTQVNGALFVSSWDSLVRFDPRTFEQKRIDVPGGLQSEGDLLFADGMLAVGCANSLAMRMQPTFLGTAGLRPVMDGFGITLPRPIPPQVQIQALLRLPEWPAVKIPLAVSSRGDGRELALAIPADTKGRVQIDLMATAGGRVLELRSMEGDGDRAKPALVLDPVGAITNRQELTISGTVRGVGPLSLEMLPSNRMLALGETGEFKAKVGLSAGENRVELDLLDALGNRIQREFVVRLDDKPPRILKVGSDTTFGGSIRIRIPYRDESEVKVAVDHPEGTGLSVFDSFAVLEVRNLVPGDNSWKASFVDEAGNVSVSEVHAYRMPGSTDGSRETVPAIIGKSARDSTKNGNKKMARDSNMVSIHVIRYRMESDENIRTVARKFYGVKEMDAILVRWNGLENAKTTISTGAVLEIPMWKGFEYGKVDPAEALEHFPWGLAPGRRKVSK